MSTVRLLKSPKFVWALAAVVWAASFEAVHVERCDYASQRLRSELVLSKWPRQRLYRVEGFWGPYELTYDEAIIELARLETRVKLLKPLSPFHRIFANDEETE
jgi:hypothetical protein